MFVEITAAMYIGFFWRQCRLESLFVFGDVIAVTSGFMSTGAYQVWGTGSPNQEARYVKGTNEQEQ